MSETLRLCFFSFALSFLILTGFILTSAQVPPPPPPPPLPPGIVGPVKTPGATVRGRVVFDDTNMPVRYAPVTLIRIGSFSSGGSLRFTKTDGNGEFVLTDVGEGEYYPYVKNEGLLRPHDLTLINVYDRTSVQAEDLFTKIGVSGTGETEVSIRAKRGGSVTGTVGYDDSEPAVAVKVQLLRRVDGRFFDRPVAETETDDRGVYRFAGLPEGTYTVRVIEPVTHSVKLSEYNPDPDFGKNLLKTYYPDSSTAAAAGEIGLSSGREEAGIDVRLPVRTLYDIGGRVVSKKTGKPLENFRVEFYSLSDKPDAGLIDVGIPDPQTGLSQYVFEEVEIPGEWSLRNLPAGKYRLVARQVIHYQKRESKDLVRYPNADIEIEVRENNGNLILAVPEPSSIRGIVEMEDGKTLPGNLRVIASNTGTGELFQSETIQPENKSAANAPAGRELRIDLLSAGRYRFGLNFSDYYISSIIIGQREIAGDEAFELKEGEKLENITVRLANDTGILKGKISGSAVGERGSICVFRKGGEVTVPSPDAFCGLIKPDGTFEVRARPGEYSVIILLQKNTPRNREGLLEVVKKALENAPSVTVTANETVERDLTLPE
jgi:hypothetical protein